MSENRFFGFYIYNFILVTVVFGFPGNVFPALIFGVGFIFGLWVFLLRESKGAKDD